MYVISNREITRTPRALARALGATLVQFPLHRLTPRPETVDMSRDIFTYYPEGIHFANVEPLAAFALVRDFARLNKYEQRKALIAAGLPGVPVFGPGDIPPAGEYVLRPLRHRAMQNFERVTLHAIPNEISMLRYGSPWLEIEKEFRTYFVRGKPVLTMFKAASGDDTQWSTTKLDRLHLLERLTMFAPLKYASLAGVDLAKTRDGNAVVFEVNFAPGLGPNNLDRIVSALKGE